MTIVNVAYAAAANLKSSLVVNLFTSSLAVKIIAVATLAFACLAFFFREQLFSLWNRQNPEMATPKIVPETKVIQSPPQEHHVSPSGEDSAILTDDSGLLPPQASPKSPVKTSIQDSQPEVPPQAETDDPKLIRKKNLAILRDLAKGLQDALDDARKETHSVPKKSESEGFKEIARTEILAAVSSRQAKRLDKEIEELEKGGFSPKFFTDGNNKCYLRIQFSENPKTATTVLGSRLNKESDLSILPKDVAKIIAEMISYSSEFMFLEIERNRFPFHAPNIIGVQSTCDRAWSTEIRLIAIANDYLKQRALPEDNKVRFEAAKTSETGIVFLSRE